jgi:hypothetical protein
MLKNLMEEITEGQRLTKSFEDACKKSIDVLKDLKNDADNEDKPRYDERIKEFEKSLKTGTINSDQFDFIVTSGFCE